MIYDYTPVGVILAKVLRDNPDFRNLNQDDDIITWSGEALGLIGVSNIYTTTPELFQVKNHRLVLPTNFVGINMIDYNGMPLKKGTGSFNKVTKPRFTNPESQITIPTEGEDYYTLNDAILGTSFRDGEITMSYYAQMLGEDGTPLIPNNPYFTKAISKYVEMKLEYPRWKRGQIRDAVYHDIVTEWDDACVAAGNSALMPDTDGMEAIKNMWFRMISNPVSWRTYFEGNNLLNTIKP